MKLEDRLVSYVEFTTEQQEQLQEFEDTLQQVTQARANFLQTIACNSHKQHIGKPVYSIRNSSYVGLLEFIEVNRVEKEGMSLLFRTDNGFCTDPGLKEEVIEAKERELEELKNEICFKTIIAQLRT